MLARALVLSALAVFVAVPQALAEYVNVLGNGHDYRQVGKLDPELSNLCAFGRFNQREKLKFSIYFKKNGVMMGGAKGTGWNLRDPTKRARKDLDYWFRNDGFSDCEVYTVELE